MFQDERGVPRQPVICDRCGVQVLVKKNSLAHTVVQWMSTTGACAELSGGPAAGFPAATCPHLVRSVDAAVRAGNVEVADLVLPPRD